MAQLFGNTQPNTAAHMAMGSRARAVLARARSFLTHGMAPSAGTSQLQLAPWIKRHKFSQLPDLPQGVSAGWVQLPNKRVFALGFFIPAAKFYQIALADDHGRVFITDQPNADLHTMQPDFWLMNDTQSQMRPRQEHASHIVHGGAVCERTNGSVMWLGTWSKHGTQYRIDQLRTSIPESYRHHLDFRDVVTVMFFAAYLLPKMNGNLLEYGAHAIIYRLHHQAPLSAIRDSVHDIEQAHAHGLHVTGLEDYAVHLLREAGALDDVPGLQADHGAEPMHLIQSTLSGNHFLTWDTSLPFDAALTSLRIEGAINRFTQLVHWLDTQRAHGITEDTLTQAQMAQIDQALLRDPALMAFDYDTPMSLIDHDPAQDLDHLLAVAQHTAHTIAEQHPDPLAADDDGMENSEWVTRQTMATLLRTMRLPYRFDVDFRDTIEQGRMAIAFTTASPALMPKSEYHADTKQWVGLSETQRAHMSAVYNLRVGMMMTALAFGTNPRIQEVTLCIDSIGLEEAIHQQDNAIKAMMSDALSSFEQWSEQGMMSAAQGAKSEALDTNTHGTSMRITPPAASTHESDDVAHEPSASVDDEFEQVMRTGGIDEVTFAMDASPAEESHQDSGEDPLEQLRSIPTLTSLVTVTFSREQFLNRMREDGLVHPETTYALFDAVMHMDQTQGLLPIESTVSIHDATFSPHDAQEAPEAALRSLPPAIRSVMGTDDSFGLSIQREDVLSHAVEQFHSIAADTNLASVDKAQEAMHLIERIGDPELLAAAPQITAALIDGKDTPELSFTFGSELDEARVRARDLFFSGQMDQAIEHIESVVARMDDVFASGDGVPRYFNSYADRVLYNHLFAISGETTVLIPDSLFYAHMELADALSQIKGSDAALPHLNKLVAYAPSYALSHIKLATQLAHDEDWDSVKAACLNALRVALDRDDAAYAYYRLAQAAWMRDEFDRASAAYIMADAIAPNQIQSLREELAEIQGRAASQNIAVPHDVLAAQMVLLRHDIPVWPSTESAPLMEQASRVSVDWGMFVVARPCAVAATRMNGTGIAPVQLQFLRSLNP